MRPVIKKIWTSDITELTDRLKRIKSGVRANALYFVFKCSNELTQKITIDERARFEITNRAQGKKAFLLRYETLKNKYLLEEITETAVVSINDSEFINQIRSYDLSEVIDRTNGDCFIDAPINTHFVTPSGKHTIRFLRLTDAIYSYNALDRISFWLQPYVAHSSAVIIDTWSLSSIILRTQQLLDVDIPFDCFHEHVKCNDELALSMLNKISRRILDDKPILVLVGISSSGEFFKALPDLVERSSINNDLNSLSIYGFKNTPDDVNVLSRMDIEIKWFDSDNCPYCGNDDRKNKYQIDSKYYYPRRYEEQPVRFNKYLLMEDDKSTRSSASILIHKYGTNEGVLAVHKDDPNDGVQPRHHAFYIDVRALMKIDEFVYEVTEVANEIQINCGVPDIVILPPHEAARSIAVHLRTLWANTKFIHSHNLKNISDYEVKLFQESSHICFVDDVSITGSRIETYLRVLREGLGGDVLGGLNDVTWFPLIIRSSSQADIDRIKDSLSGHDSHWKNHLLYTYKIILPDWTGENECPWCKEEAVLDKHIGPLWDEPKWYRERRSLLRNTTRGIQKNPLFVFPFSEHKTLGAGSAIGDEGLSEIQVIFLLANGLQILRTTTGHTLGADDLLVRYVLFFENNSQVSNSGTFTRFSEPFIQSCFLRTVKTDEWTRTVWDDGMNFFKGKLESSNSNELIGELLLFYLRRGVKGKFKQSTIDIINGIYYDEASQLLIASLKE